VHFFVCIEDIFSTLPGCGVSMLPNVPFTFFQGYWQLDGEGVVTTVFSCGSRGLKSGEDFLQ